jgi:hypothetical protein
MQELADPGSSLVRAHALGLLGNELRSGARHDCLLIGAAGNATGLASSDLPGNRDCPKAWVVKQKLTKPRHFKGPGPNVRIERTFPSSVRP